MTWQRYAKLWLVRYVGNVTHLTREQAARYIRAVTQFAKASRKMQALLLKQVKK